MWSVMLLLSDEPMHRHGDETCHSIFSFSSVRGGSGRRASQRNATQHDDTIRHDTKIKYNTIQYNTILVMQWIQRGTERKEERRCMKT